MGLRDTENQIPPAILRSLVVGELRGMISRRFYQKMSKLWGAQDILVHYTIPQLAFAIRPAPIVTGAAMGTIGAETHHTRIS